MLACWQDCEIIAQLLLAMRVVRPRPAASRRGSFYAYKEKLILNKSEALKADDVNKSYDIGFFYE